MLSLLLNKKQMAVSFIIGLLCCIGDKNSENHTDALVAAICDNVTHALIGAFTYIGAYITRTSNTDFYFIFEFFLCAVCSSLIDLDHFAAAKSIHIKDAVSLKNRPFLHCTTTAIFIISLVLLLSHFTKLTWMYKFGWILAAAFISHHIRDSKRRGFWLWPFGHTKPTPIALYIFGQMFYPQLLSVLISKFSPFDVAHREFRPIVETV